MNVSGDSTLYRTSYDRADCAIGVVHIGFGAFHRAHQAVYIDDYMQVTDDLRWGIAAVNLRASESEQFELAKSADGNTLLKTTSPNGSERFREVRSHVRFADWSQDPAGSEALIALQSVHIVSMTVTEAGYYLNAAGELNLDDPLIAKELAGKTSASVYAYLALALEQRMVVAGAPLTLLCCDNIRSNGDVLRRNFLSWLSHAGKDALHDWVMANVAFPCSMVDRITPRTTDALRDEVKTLFPAVANQPIHGETFTQWVIEKNFAGPMPDLEKSGAEFVDDVHPFEEAKIRILNGGHTSLAYYGALAGHRTFDEAMRDPDIRKYFDAWQDDEVLPGITLDLPFNKNDYKIAVAHRFENSAIADALERICMDGYSKFAIFVRPTLESCLEQGIEPHGGYGVIASWYVFCRRFVAGQTSVPYEDAAWESLQPLLAAGREEDFATHRPLWGDLPTRYPNFASNIQHAIDKLESSWQT